MGRSVILGNGSLTVGINERGLVHDFYYPYVGLDNLNNARSAHHKIGVWVDGQFSWADDENWHNEVTFDDNALVSEVHKKNDNLQIEITTHDFVDSEFNAFLRQITVINHADHQREIRVFLHQVFQISRAGRADTALFVPEANYILDYKGRCALLIYGQDGDGKVFDQFAIGNYAIEGKEGTYKDAEDGELSNSPVEHGGVDSVMRFVCHPDAGQSSKIDYWIVAADSQYNAEAIHTQIISHGLSGRLESTLKYWQDWFAPSNERLDKLDEKYRSAVKKSLLVIKAHCDRRGGIIASCDSSIFNYGRDYYCYVWPRDGAYAIWPLIKLGHTEEAKKFFEFCRDILTTSGYLMHKYQPDRAIGSTWHPLLHGKRKELAIQEDETAIVIYMLGEYYTYTKDEDFVRNLYITLIQPSGNFLSTFTDEHTNLPHASYDLWEEKFSTSAYTTAITHKALLVAADFADKFEFPDDGVKWRAAAETIASGTSVFIDPDRKVIRKGFLLQEDGSLQFDNTLDLSSLYAAVHFGENVFADEDVDQTVSLIESLLLDKSPSGGCPRYDYDHYFESNPAFMGNPWFITTLWMSQYYVRNKQADKAKHYIDWTLEHTLPSGVLSEQINPSDGSPLSVTPLVWSHAELINTVLDLDLEA